MRTKHSRLKVLVFGSLAVFLLTIVAEAMAFGPGGGRGGGPRGGPRGGHHMGRMHHHRMGPASGGSFSSRPTHRSGMRRPMRSTSPMQHANRRTPSRSVAPPPTRPSQPLPPPEVPSEEQLEKRAKMHEKQARRREERREDHWDHYHHRRHREELGTTYTSDYWDDDYCEATVVVDGVTYYECDGVWYRQAYSGGEVTYVVVEGPRSD